MDNPLISIIVPVYNLCDYINNTLDSIFQQTYTNIEVIAVDDGSTDGSAEALDKYLKKEDRLVVYHKKNGGVTDARLKGIEVSKGDYIGFVDGDDLIDPDMYERLIKNALNNHADISHCGYRIIRNSKVEYFYNTSKRIIQSNHAGIVDLLEGKFIEPGLCNKLFNKRLFSNLFNNDNFDRTLAINEDLQMNYFLFRASERSVFEDFCPYQYYKREGSASQGRKRPAFYEHPFKVRQIIMNDCVGTPEEDDAKKFFLSKAMNILCDLSCRNEENFVQLKKEIMDKLKEYDEFSNLLPKKQYYNYKLLKISPKLFFTINKFYRRLR